MMFVALLRAINVGGRVVKMERLRSIFSGLGFSRVATFIQSGNVIFESEEEDRTVIRKRIEDALRGELGYEVPTVVRSLDQLRAAVALDPFKGTEPADDLRFVVIFTYEPVSAAQIDPEKAAAKGFRFVAETPSEIFILMRQFDGKPGNPVAFLEKELKTKMTARFYGATVKLLDAAEAHVKGFT